MESIRVNGVASWLQCFCETLKSANYCSTILHLDMLARKAGHGPPRKAQCLLMEEGKAMLYDRI